MNDENGKELVLTPPPTEIAKRRERSKPSLIQVGNRYISSDGRFHPGLAAEYIRANGKNKWLKIGDLSKVFRGANTIDGKRHVRKSLFSVFTRLLAYGEFLVYETEIGTGRTMAVKLLDVKSEEERQAARPQLERMRQRRQVSTEKYEKALQVIDCKESMLSVEPLKGDA